MAADQAKKWRCTVCDYVHEGDTPPDACPICGAGPELFVLEGEQEQGQEQQQEQPPDQAADDDLTWHRVAGLEDLPEGGVSTVTAAGQTLALTRFEGQYGALDNACPHQGGPLGEGTIEAGNLRCPWHGWDFHPLTGQSPEGYEDHVQSHPCQQREDGVHVGLPAAAPRPRTVSDVMVETMVNWGVTHVFGMVGHSNLGLAEAIRRQEQQGKLRFIGVRHEGAAAFAASAFAKLTRRPAACLSIAGPGATNLLTGLWDARVDRAPVLALTGQVDTQVLGPGAFQELDLAAAFQSVAAWSQTVLSNSRHAELMTLALKHALLQRDVAHLIFPDEVQNQPADAAASTPEGRITPLQIQPPQESLDQALERLRGSRRPAIIVGHGAREAISSITSLAEQLGAPVITTFKAKGLIPDDHPLACGVLGRSGTPVAAHFMNEADLLLVLGASFSRHTGITPDVPTIQVDFDPLALGRFHPVEVPVYGEIGVTTCLLEQGLSDGGAGQPFEDHRPEVAAHRQRWQAEKQKRAARDQGRGMSSAVVFEALTRRLPADAVIAVDVGNNTYSFGRYFECQRQAVLMSGYLGSIGFGYPAAIGAWAAAPDRPVVAITGDGGFGQYLAELCTAVKYGMGITHVLLNNSELGKITKEQRAAGLPVWSTTLHNPDFAAFARDCGALGIRVTEASKLDSALREALAHPGPSLVELLTDPELV